MAWLDRLVTLLAWVAGGLAAAMMVVTFLDVVCRYLLNRPIYGAFEATEILMGLIVFAALPLVAWQRENITVTLLYDRYPPLLRRVATAMTELVSALLCGLVAWRMWLYGERLLRSGEVTLELRVPRGGIAMTMAVLLAFTALVLALSALQAARADPGSRAGPADGA